MRRIYSSWNTRGSALICEKCRAVNPDDNNYCGKCGNALVPPSRPDRTLTWSAGIALVVIGAAVLLFMSAVFLLALSITGQNSDLASSGWVADLYSFTDRWNVDLLGLNIVVVGLALISSSMVKSGGWSRGPHRLMALGAVACIIGQLLACTLGNPDLAGQQMEYSTGTYWYLYTGVALSYFGAALSFVGLVLAVRTSRQNRSEMSE